MLNCQGVPRPGEGAVAEIRREGKIPLILVYLTRNTNAKH